MEDRNRDQRGSYNQQNSNWQDDSERYNRQGQQSSNSDNTNYNQGQQNRNQWQGSSYGNDDYGRGHGEGFNSGYNASQNNPYQSRNRGFNQGGQQGASYGNQQGREQSWNRNEDQWGSAGMYGGDFGRDDWERGSIYGRSQYGNQQNMNYGSYGNQQQDRSRYSRSNQGNYNQSNRGDNDNSWWDRTRNKVSSWFNDDDDDRQRGQNQYSTGHRGKGPKDYQRSTDRIREDICDRLSDDDHLDATHIQVQVQGNEVILSGTVNERYQKRYAEDLVESVSGVRHVENRIRVGSASGDLSAHDYTGNTDKIGGIGTESGTTNEIIRNVANDKNKNR